jgi:hypothetical protein
MTLQPDAKDTLQGIHDWWLAASNDPCDLAEVEQAVETLVNWGWLAKHRLADQTVVYGPTQIDLQQRLQYLRKSTN